MYKPLGGSDFEYIELKNIHRLDLTKVRFTNGIEHTFQPKTLRAGATLVLANDSTAFESVITTPDGDILQSLQWRRKLRLGPPPVSAFLNSTTQMPGMKTPTEMAFP